MNVSIAEKYLGLMGDIWKHENKCFDNPKTQSCKTCGNYDGTYLIFGDRRLTDNEKNIYFSQPEEFCDTGEDYNPDTGYESEYAIFKGEYEYLNNVDYSDNVYCLGKNCNLKKLTTNCEYWKLKDSK